MFHFLGRGPLARLCSVAVLVVLAALLTGCQGVRFTDLTNVNKPLSPEMLGTSIVTDTEIQKRHLDEVVDVVMAEEPDGTYKEVTSIPPAVKPTVTDIKDKNSFYHSVIDNTYGGSASYLSLISIKLDAEHKVDISVQETQEAHIANGDVPYDKIIAWGRAHTPPVNTKYVYVQTALASAVAQTIYTKLSANATVSGGPAVSANGSIYATNEDNDTSNTVYIGAHLLDVQMMLDNAPNTANIHIQTLAPHEASPYALPGKVIKKWSFQD
jgi:hypothetical protein